MKISKYATHIHDGNYIGFQIEGHIDDVQACLSTLKSSEIPEVMDMKWNEGSKRCTLYFEAGTPHRELVIAQYKLNQHPKLKTNLGFFNPSYVGWRWLIKNFGFAFILYNLPTMLMSFLRGHFLKGNMGLTRGESVFVTLVHALFMGALFYYMVGLGTDNNLIRFIMGIALWHTLSSTLSYSIPKVGDANLNGYSDEDTLQIICFILFAALFVIAYLPLLLVWQTAILALCIGWFLYRAYAKPATADYSL